MLLRVWISIALVATCTASTQATAKSAEAGVSRAIFAWLLKLRAQAFSLLFPGQSRAYLPSASGVFLADLAVKKPATTAAPIITDVPRAHFVTLGPGGALPDFEGPFSVDAIYINKRWGDAIYYAVWTGYYRHRWIAVGADAQSTYGDICRYLAGEDASSVFESLVPLPRWLWRSAPRLYEHVTDAMVKTLLISTERHTLIALGLRAVWIDNACCVIARLLSYWLSWLLWWNTLRWLSRLWGWPPVRISNARRSSVLQELVPRSFVCSGPRVLDGLGAAVFASPASLAGLACYAARVAATPLIGDCWSSVYASHRRVVLERCIGMTRRQA